MLFKQHVVFDVGVWWWFFYLWFLERNQETKMWRSQFTTWHKSFEKMDRGFVHNFPWDAVKVSTMIQQDTVQRTWCFWFLVMIFLLWFLEKDQETKLWRSTFTTCHMSFKQITSHLKRWVGGSVHIFFMGCCKSVHYDLKGCCSNNMLFLMLVFGHGFSICSSRRKIKKQNCEDQHLPHVTSHSKR